MARAAGVLRRLILADEAEMPTSLLDLVAVQGRPGLRDALDALASDAAPQTLELPLRTPAGLPLSYEVITLTAHK